ncbi:MAG TPA: GNAT family N-acetyltransferase [Anaerolineales bacterium]|jgi:ribosomal protein S18 acetylase RimI-like enzyme|nr:GNAT family N-acetyltransferase [Anaerolineales bacterium]
MKIRQATPADSLVLSSLCKDVQSLHAEHHPDVFKAPESEDFATSFFEEALADLTIRIFVAENEEQALGYILCKSVEREESPFIYARRYLMIDQIGVRPMARGQGVGVALIQRAEELAKELGVPRIQLDSWDFNVRAHAFFEKQGFQKFMFRFWRVL